MRVPSRLAAALAAILALPAGGAAAECTKTPYDCALEHLGRREFADAVRHLERQLVAVPRDLKALNLLGITLTASGRREEGSARFRAALALDPAFHPALKNLAINEYDAGRYRAARKAFEEVLKSAPADEVAHVYMGEIHVRGKRCPAALEHYARSGDRYAQAPAWTLHYGGCLLEAGQPAAAAAVLDKLPPDDGAARFEAAVALGKAGAHAQAARFFAAARRVLKDPYDAGYNEALMRIRAGDHEGAVRVADEMAAAGQARPDLYNLVSRAYAGLGRIQEAYDALRQAARMDPRAPENYVDLASIALEHENFDLGLEIVDVGLRHLPDSSLLHLQRGVLLAMKGEMAPAEASFEAARRLSPHEPAIHAALAMVWMQGGQTDKAVEALRAELARARANHVVPYIFAVALLRSGVEAGSPEGAEALEALRASVRANGAFAPARAELGKLLLRRDEVEAAVAELEKATALDPESTPALYALAQAYRKKGDVEKAQPLLARVSKLNAGERGDDPDRELRRTLIRIVRDGAPGGRP